LFPTLRFLVALCPVAACAGMNPVTG
jgi:hypothetical protein